MLDPGAELCAVIKADGYGHGAEDCASAALAGGAERLAVATASEAARIGERFGDVPLLTMGALSPEEVDVALAAGSEIAVWRRGFAACSRPAPAPRVVPLGSTSSTTAGWGDSATPTGARFWSWPAPAPRTPIWSWLGLWTHFATADEPESDFFEHQLSDFSALASELRSEFPELTVHAANSAAVFRERRAHFDMARCGVAIYGLDPSRLTRPSAG